MKYLIVLLMLFVSISCASQTPSPPVENKPPPDSIAFINTKQFDQFFTWLKDNLVQSKYEKLTPNETLSYFFQWAVVEWNRKKKK